MRHDSVEKAKIARELLEYIASLDITALTGKGVKQANGSTIRISNNFKKVKIQMNELTFAEKQTLQICLGIMEEESKQVILVTNNLTLQIKAKLLGIKAESFKDEIFPKLSEQYTGRIKVFTSNDSIDLLYKDGAIDIDHLYDVSELVENQFLQIVSESKSTLGVYKKGKIHLLAHQKKYPYGIQPKNVGQKFMIEALLSDEYPLVVIKGNAGTGKTFCTLAAGLEETVENHKYSRILVTRSVTATEQYGFLPGDIEEKLSPYLAGIKDNLSILMNSSKKNKEENQENGEYYFESRIVQIQAIGFLRGRSIVDTYFIIDETQNIEPDVIKSIVTRAAEGSKFIFLGDPTQIDNPNLTERYNGLVYLSEKMKGNPLCAQLTLMDDESVRSSLAKEAARIL